MVENESGLTVTADKVLIKPMKVEETTGGGIIIASQTKLREQMAQQVGVILAMGGTCKLLDLNGFPRVPELEGIEVGDTILYNRYSGKDFPVDGVEYRIIRASDVLGKATRPLDSVLRGAQSTAEVFGINKVA